MKIVLYSTGCPQCTVLEKKLAEKGINYDLCEDIDTMTNMGIKKVPMLEVDGELMEFNKKLIEYINTL